MRGEEGDCLALPLMGISAPTVLYPELPCSSGTHSRAPVAALSLLEVTDVVSPSTQLTQALQKMSGTAHRLCVSRAGAGVDISEGQCLCAEARP